MNNINLDKILEKHFYEKYGKDTITWKGSMFKITYQEWVTKAIKEIIEAVIDKCAEEAKHKGGGAYSDGEILTSLPISVNKDSILNVKTMVNYG